MYLFLSRACEKYSALINEAKSHYSNNTSEWTCAQSFVTPLYSSLIFCLSLPTLKSLYVYIFMSRECDIHVRELHVHVCHTLSFVASVLFHFVPPSPLPPDPNRDLCITTLSGVFLLNLQEYGFLIHCDQKYINLHERVSTICTHTLCLQPVKLHKQTHTHTLMHLHHYMYMCKSMLVPLTS